MVFRKGKQSNVSSECDKIYMGLSNVWRPLLDFIDNAGTNPEPEEPTIGIELRLGR